MLNSFFCSTSQRVCQEYIKRQNKYYGITDRSKISQVEKMTLLTRPLPGW